jgi:hypothetical protein
MVAQGCNPSYSGSTELWSKTSLGKKFLRPHLNQWLGVVAYTFYPRYMGKHK